MNTKSIKSMGLILWTVLFVALSPGSGAAGPNKNNKMTENEYNQRLQAQTQYHQLRLAGNQAKQRGEFNKAIAFHEQAVKLAKGSSLEAVSRGTLMDLYEKVGNYDKALVHANWFLTHSNKESPMWPEFVETEKRLRQKVEEKKTWELKQDPVVPDFREAFDRADNAQQERMLESLGVGVFGIYSKMLWWQSMGRFRKHVKFTACFPGKRNRHANGDGGAMLYPAIQRTSELLGDDVREKEALIWIKDNLLNGEGQHHGSLKKLRPEVVLHIQKRIEKFQL